MNINDRKCKLILAVNACESISQLFELVRQEKIILRMQSLQSASCIPMRPHNIPKGDTEDTPLSRLKEAVCACVINS